MPLILPAPSTPIPGSREKNRETRQMENPWSIGRARQEEFKDHTAIDRTKYGILLLMISIVLGPIPYITYLGTVLALVGAVLMILGRKAFGQAHSNIVNLSVGIWIFGIVISIIAGIAYGIDVATAIAGSQPGLASQPALAQSLSDAFNNLLIAILVGSAVLGLAEVLITFRLQSFEGRVLLFTGYALGLGMAIALAATVAPQVNAAVAQAISSNDLGPLNSLRAQSTLLGLLGIIPASLSALAFYLVYKRIDDNEIPDSRTLPAWS